MPQPRIDQLLQTKQDEDGYSYREVWDPQRPLVLNILSHNYVSFPVLDPAFIYEAGIFNHGDAHTYLFSPRGTDAASIVAYWQQNGFWILAHGDILAPDCAPKDCRITLYGTKDRRQALDIATASRSVYVLFHPFDPGPRLPDRPKLPTGGPLGFPWYVAPSGQPGFDQFGNLLPWVLGLPTSSLEALASSILGMIPR